MAEQDSARAASGPTSNRLSSKERHAARVAEIANKQSELKREAAERRAKREAEDRAKAKPASE